MLGPHELSLGEYCSREKDCNLKSKIFKVLIKTGWKVKFFFVFEKTECFEKIKRRLCFCLVDVYLMKCKI
jgi:hypothetical protein